MRKYLPFVAILALFSCQDQNRSIAGLWKIHTIEQQNDSGNWETADWMKNGLGYLHYDNKRNMSIHFIPENYEEFVIPENIEKKDWEFELLDNFSSDYWYVGEYTILSQNEIEHRRIMHSDPNENDVRVIRGFRFSGDTLIISAKEFGLRLMWLPVN